MFGAATKKISKKEMMGKFKAAFRMILHSGEVIFLTFLLG